MINPIVYTANRGGIPRIQSKSVTVTTSNVAYDFTADVKFSSNFSGLILVKLNQAIPSGTATTLPIVFASSAGTQALTTYGGASVTVAELSGTGIYLCYYDRGSNTLQLLTGLEASA